MSLRRVIEVRVGAPGLRGEWWKNKRRNGVQNDKDNHHKLESKKLHGFFFQYIRLEYKHLHTPKEYLLCKWNWVCFQIPDTLWRRLSLVSVFVFSPKKMSTNCLQKESVCFNQRPGNICRWGETEGNCFPELFLKNFILLKYSWFTMLC